MVFRFRLLFLLLALALSVPPADAQALRSRVDQLLETGEASSALWGVYIRDVETGEVLYRRNADKAMMPASTMKLLTMAVALDAFGSDYRYRTTLYLDGEIEGSTLRGDLILRGSGDPTFASYSWGSWTGQAPAPNPLKAWAERLAALGIERIEGRLIGDDDRFDDTYYAEGWDVSYVTDQASSSLGVSASGLSSLDNVVRVRIEASRPGQPPNVSTLPSQYMEVRNDAVTSSRSRGQALDLRRPLGDEAVALEGSVPRRYDRTVFVPAVNPTRFTMQAFKNQMEVAGINVQGAEVVDIDELRGYSYRDEAEPLFVHRSAPLGEILQLVVKKSNNFYAEQIFRSVSYGGEARGGERRIKELLRRAGADVDGISIRDGSGLSRKDLVTPEALGTLLDYMASHGEAEAFREALAEGGEAESTLRYRLRGLPVEAKTGSLAYVRALAGYAETGDGRQVAFVVIANNFTAPGYVMTRTIDRVVGAITTLSAA